MWKGYWSSSDMFLASSWQSLISCSSTSRTFHHLHLCYCFDRFIGGVWCQIQCLWWTVQSSDYLWGYVCHIAMEWHECLLSLEVTFDFWFFWCLFGADHIMTSLPVASGNATESTDEIHFLKCWPEDIEQIIIYLSITSVGSWWLNGKSLHIVAAMHDEDHDVIFCDWQSQA